VHVTREHDLLATFLSDAVQPRPTDGLPQPAERETERLQRQRSRQGLPCSRSSAGAASTASLGETHLPACSGNRHEMMAAAVAAARGRRGRGAAPPEQSRLFAPGGHAAYT